MNGSNSYRVKDAEGSYFYCRVLWAEYPSLTPCAQQCTDCADTERDRETDPHATTLHTSKEKT